MNRFVLLLPLVALACGEAAPAESKASTSSSIIGGTSASINAWPGVGQIETDDGPQCGASLVAPEWVITAAHCFDAKLNNGGFRRVVFGRQVSTTSAGESITVAKAIRHPSYVDSDNDIALIRLSRPVTRAPARLVTANEWATLGRDGAMTTVVGWGATFEGGEMSTSLNQVSVPIVSTSSCNSAYEGTITNNMICAGVSQGGKDSCQGDSGGPLYLDINGAPVQVGVVSFGEGCARAGFPGVYTKVASYLDWLSTNSNGAIVAGATTTPDAGVPTTDAGTKDDSTDVPDETDEETTTADADEETPKKKTTSKRTTAPLTSSGCALGGPTSDSAATFALVLAVGLGLVSARRRRRG